MPPHPLTEASLAYSALEECIDTVGRVLGRERRCKDAEHEAMAALILDRLEAVRQRADAFAQSMQNERAA